MKMESVDTFILKHFASSFVGETSKESEHCLKNSLKALTHVKRYMPMLIKIKIIIIK